MASVGSGVAASDDTVRMRHPAICCSLLRYFLLSLKGGRVFPWTGYPWPSMERGLLTSSVGWNTASE
eukprot:2366564-Amphidinium_carterae.1